MTSPIVVGTPAGGNLAGTYPNPQVQQIQNRAIAPTAPNNGEVLTWVAANNRWEPRPPPSPAVDGFSILWETNFTTWPTTTFVQGLNTVNGVNFYFKNRGDSTGRYGMGFTNGSGLHYKYNDTVGTEVTTQAWINRTDPRIGTMVPLDQFVGYRTDRPILVQMTFQIYWDAVNINRDASRPSIALLKNSPKDGSNISQDETDTVILPAFYSGSGNNTSGGFNYYRPGTATAPGQDVSGYLGGRLGIGIVVEVGYDPVTALRWGRAIYSPSGWPSLLGRPPVNVTSTGIYNTPQPLTDKISLLFDAYWFWTGFPDISGTVASHVKKVRVLQQGSL